MEKRWSQPFYAFLGYIVILLILVAVALIIGAGVYLLLPGPGVEISRESIQAWSAFIVYTLLVFGYVIKESRGLWRNKRFWATIAALLLGHALSFWATLPYIAQWRFRGFALLYGIEGLLVFWALDHITGRFAKGPDSG